MPIMEVPYLYWSSNPILYALFMGGKAIFPECARAPAHFFLNKSALFFALTKKGARSSYPWPGWLNRRAKYLVITFAYTIFKLKNSPGNP